MRGKGKVIPLSYFVQLENWDKLWLCAMHKINTDLTFLPQFKVHHVNHLLGKPLTMPFVPGFADV